MRSGQAAHRLALVERVGGLLDFGLVQPKDVVGLLDRTGLNQTASQFQQHLPQERIAQAQIGQAVFAQRRSRLRPPDQLAKES